MADITKCDNKECPLAHKCKRFLAASNELLQSWFMENPNPRNDNNCNEFLPIKEEK